MYKLVHVLRWTLCALLLAGSGTTLAGQNILFYHSEPGDYIGGGVDATFDATMGTFSVLASISPSWVRLSFNTPSYSHWWYLNLVAPNNAPLQPGAYEGSARWPFQAATQPGLDFSGDGRGCNTSTGRFDVYELVRDGTGTIVQFAANWEQHCEGMVPALFGQIRFNSDVPIIKPVSILLTSSVNRNQCVEATSPQGGLITMNAAGNDATGGTSLSYSWSSTTGDVGTASSFSFNAPLTATPANPAVVTLSVTDLTNNSVRTATKSVCVSDTTPPVVTINSPKPGQVVSGENVILDVTIKDAVDKNITAYEVLVGSDMLSPLDPTTGHARQRILQTPKVNGSIATTVTVRALDASGNVGQQSVTFSRVP